MTKWNMQNLKYQSLKCHLVPLRSPQIACLGLSLSLKHNHWAVPVRVLLVFPGYKVECSYSMGNAILQ